METNSELKYIFANINDLLKFAEAKNAGLIVLNSAIIIGIITCYSNIHSLLIKPVTIIGLIALGVSIVISLFSQFPVTQNIIIHKKTIPNPNLYFYGHLSYLSIADLTSAIQLRFVNFSPTMFDNDLMNQIIVNSKITLTKFTLFKYASYLTVFGCGLIGFTLVIRQVWHF